MVSQGVIQQARVAVDQYLTAHKLYAGQPFSQPANDAIRQKAAQLDATIVQLGFADIQDFFEQEKALQAQQKQQALEDYNNSLVTLPQTSYRLVTMPLINHQQSDYINQNAMKLRDADQISDSFYYCYRVSPGPLVRCSPNERGQKTLARARAAGLETKIFPKHKNSNFLATVSHRFILVTKSPDTIREQTLSVVFRVLRRFGLQPKITSISGNNLLGNGKRICLMSHRVYNDAARFSVSINDQMPIGLYHQVIGVHPTDVTSLEAELHAVSQQDMAAAVQACGNFQADILSQVEASTYGN